VRKKTNAVCGGRILEKSEKSPPEFLAPRFREECRQNTFIGQPTIVGYWLLAIGC
jgi:hypothetical protein